MSIVMGMRNNHGQPVGESNLLHMAKVTERWGPDGTFTRIRRRVGMAFQAFRTDERSRLESLPAIDFEGNIATIDGRLDNYTELADVLGSSPETPDSSLILGAFRRWGTQCFERFIGDWAICICSSSDQEIFLARDHAGTRSLYFANGVEELRWSTYLDSFFADAVPSRCLDETYVASFLTLQPLRDLTPYSDIRSVLPGHYVRFSRDRAFTVRHWEPSSSKIIRYRDLRDYDNQFLALFTQAIKRRLKPKDGVIAHLSGGIDSSSIVCMSDSLSIMKESAGRLSTLSYFDDTDPSWDEQPFFSHIEEYRGQRGIHIRTIFADKSLEPADPREAIYRLPGADKNTILRERRLIEQLESGSFRVFLAGTGGDELLGGVPDPFPELATLFLSGKTIYGMKKAISWCLPSRTPLLHMLKRCIHFIWSLYCGKGAVGPWPVWLNSSLRARAIESVHHDPASTASYRHSVHSLSNIAAWWSIMESLPSSFPGYLTRYEFRYPYLDKDLVNFLLGIPSEVLVGPGQRRIMMRRALEGIVPEVVLQRKQKSFLARGPVAYIANHIPELQKVFKESILADRGYVDPKPILKEAEMVPSGANPSAIKFLLRAISLELWLRSENMAV